MTFAELQQQVLLGLGTLISLGVLYLIERAVAWLRARLSAERSAALSAAINKLVMFGVTRATAYLERPGGWSDPNTKEFVKAVALAAFPDKFPGALKGAGLDINNPQNRALLSDAIDRAIPAVFTEAAASPATPPAPTPAAVPVVVVGQTTVDLNREEIAKSGG
jgi:hypothetical protein